jgi:hypothetical protein
LNFPRFSNFPRSFEFPAPVQISRAFFRQVHPKSDDWSSLIEAVGTDVLPVEYGGTNGTIQDHIGKAQWAKKRRFRNFFER